MKKPDPFLLPMPKNTLHSMQAAFEKTLYRIACRRAYMYMLDRMVLFLGKDRAPEDVFRSDLNALRAHLKETYGINGGTTMHQYMRAGCSFYNWMDAMDYVPIGFNPFRAVTPRIKIPEEWKIDE